MEIGSHGLDHVSLPRGRRHTAKCRDRTQPGDPAGADRPADTRILLSVQDTWTLVS